MGFQPLTTRRAFVSKCLLLISAIPFIGVIACGDKRKLRKCVTTEDILGPFYRENAPTRMNLIVGSQAGTSLNITGKIYGEDCETPLADATLDIWHADDAGEYDNSSPDYLFRGKVKTDSDGTYQFDTIVPGKYLNGSNYRPSHIHFKITASGHKELTTQLYFAGDPDIPADTWASDESAEERIITLEDSGNGKMSNFNVKLLPI